MSEEQHTTYILSGDAETGLHRTYTVSPLPFDLRLRVKPSDAAARNAPGGERKAEPGAYEGEIGHRRNSNVDGERNNEPASAAAHLPLVRPSVPLVALFLASPLVRPAATGRG